MASNPSFNGASVLVLESRRSKEMASLVTTYGRVPISAPSMREIPLESNVEAADAARTLLGGGFDLVVLLTGVGTRAWLDVVDKVLGERGAFVEALKKVPVAARGPKPVAVLRELQIAPWLIAPEPNTWRDLLAAFDAKADERSLNGLRVAVQEYGATNEDLLAGLRERGAIATRVPVYQWALPDDLAPLEAGIRALVDGTVDVVMLTTATQLVHLLQVAETLGLRAAVLEALRRVMLASIGPTTSEELRRNGLEPAFEPSHPKMGFLAREAAELAARLHDRA